MTRDELRAAFQEAKRAGDVGRLLGYHRVAFHKYKDCQEGKEKALWAVLMVEIGDTYDSLTWVG